MVCVLSVFLFCEPVLFVPPGLGQRDQVEQKKTKSIKYERDCDRGLANQPSHPLTVGDDDGTAEGSKPQRWFAGILRT